MTRRVVEKLCTKKVCVDFLGPMNGEFIPEGQRYKIVSPALKTVTSLNKEARLLKFRFS